MGLLISPEELAGVLGDVTVLDVRYQLGRSDGHEEYLAGLPGHPAPKDMLPMIASMQGRALGVEHAVLFRAYDLQAPPPLLA